MEEQLAQRRISFLDLPLECRQIIYGFLFVDNIVKVTNDGEHALEFSEWRLHSQILSTTKQILEEARHYYTTELHIDRWSRMNEEFFRNMSPMLRNAVTSIVLRNTRIYSDGPVFTTQFFPNLKCLTVTDIHHVPSTYGRGEIPNIAWCQGLHGYHARVWANALSATVYQQYKEGLRDTWLLAWAKQTTDRNATRADMGPEARGCRLIVEMPAVINLHDVTAEKTEIDQGKVVFRYDYDTEEILSRCWSSQPITRGRSYDLCVPTSSVSITLFKGW